MAQMRLKQSDGGGSVEVVKDGVIVNPSAIKNFLLFLRVGSGSPIDKKSVQVGGPTTSSVWNNASNQTLQGSYIQSNGIRFYYFAKQATRADYQAYTYIVAKGGYKSFDIELDFSIRTASNTLDFGGSFNWMTCASWADIGFIVQYGGERGKTISGTKSFTNCPLLDIDGEKGIRIFMQVQPNNEGRVMQFENSVIIKKLILYK